MAFRERLLSTIRAARPVLEAPGILIVGSEVPNLLEPDAASTLVVSQDLDIGVPVDRHADVKPRLDELHAFQPSPDEPSIWLPRDPGMLELNFLGVDSRQDPSAVYVLEDERLPLLVFGALSLIVPGEAMDLGGTRVVLPKRAGLILEKLVTDRTGEKGDRDLLVALGLLLTGSAVDFDELEAGYRALRPELRHAIRSNLSVLSLIEARTGMPDPRPHRALVASLLHRFEIGEADPS